MLIWYKMMPKFSYEHNIEHTGSKIRTLHPKILGKIYLEPNYLGAAGWLLLLIFEMGSQLI